MTIRITRAQFDKIRAKSGVRGETLESSLEAVGIVVHPTAEIADAQEAVFRELRSQMSGWAGAARENHDACGHRDEVEPCWTIWSEADINVMIADARRALGLDP